MQYLIAKRSVFVNISLEILGVVAFLTSVRNFLKSANLLHKWGFGMYVFSLINFATTINSSIDVAKTDF